MAPALDQGQLGGFLATLAKSVETSYWSEVLLIDKGSGWVDLSEMRVSTNSYPTPLAMREFPFDDKRAPANPLDRSYSSVVVSQKSASRADFEAISGCLAKNIVAIDHAFLAARPELQAGSYDD
jgi:hypothetical protein